MNLPFKTFQPSPDIDVQAVMTYFIEKREMADGEDDVTLELTDADTPFLPTPQEICDAFYRTASEIQTLLVRLVNDVSTKTEAIQELTQEDVNAACEISTLASFRHKLVTDLRNLQSDEIDQEGIPPYTINLDSDLDHLVANVKGLAFKNDFGDVDADAVFDGEEPPIFAHRATDTYHGVIAEILMLAKPFSEELDKQNRIEPVCMALGHFHRTTKSWIDQTRCRRGFAPLFG